VIQAELHFYEFLAGVNYKPFLSERIDEQEIKKKKERLKYKKTERK